MTAITDFSLATIDEIEAELGHRLESTRLQQNISQAQLAEAAGVSRRTITRLENGEGISVETLIRIMRALGIENRLAALVPEPAVSPVDRVRLQGQQRQRAGRKTQESSGDWQWGDARDSDSQ
jgi:transcriptional regulator with XRE-family HTH domain